MTSALSTVPASRRRRSALFAGVFAVVLLVAGLLPWFGGAESSIKFLAAFVVAAGLLAGLVAVGLLRSLSVAPPSRSIGGGCGGGCQCGQQGTGC